MNCGNRQYNLAELIAKNLEKSKIDQGAICAQRTDGSLTIFLPDLDLDIDIGEDNNIVINASSDWHGYLDAEDMQVMIPVIKAINRAKKQFVAKLAKEKSTKLSEQDTSAKSIEEVRVKLI